MTRSKQVQHCSTTRRVSLDHVRPLFVHQATYQGLTYQRALADIIGQLRDFRVRLKMALEVKTDSVAGNHRALSVCSQSAVWPAPALCGE